MITRVVKHESVELVSMRKCTSTFAMTVRAIRDGEEISLDQFARKLGVSRSHLCDIEKGRKGVSPERAARWAELLGYPATQFVRLAIQADLDAAGLKYNVDIEAA